MSRNKSELVPVSFINPADIIDPVELAQRLRVKPTTIYEWMRRRDAPDALPYFRVGRFLRFRWSEVSQWLLSSRAKPDRLGHIGGRRRKKMRANSSAVSAKAVSA